MRETLQEQLRSRATAMDLWRGDSRLAMEIQILLVKASDRIDQQENRIAQQDCLLNTINLVSRISK